MHHRSIKSLIVLGSTLLCVLGFEVALRIAGYNPFGDLLNGRELIIRESNNPDMNYELTPNSEGFVRGAEIKVNSFGFRDRDYNTKKSDGIYRIVIIGDSITFGNFLPIEATFPKRLEQSFRQHRMPVEVLNLGVGGYNTIQEVAFLQQLGLQFDPDEVIVGYCMNDVGVVSPNLNYIRRVRTYGAPVYNLRFLQFVRSKLDIIEARIYSFFSTRNDKEKLKDNKKSLSSIGDVYLSERIRDIENYISYDSDYHRVFSWYSSAHKLSNIRAGFERLKALSRQYGFKVSVMIIPFVLEHVDAYDAAYDIVRHEARRNGFDVIEVLQEFIDTNIKYLKIRPSDGIHPNELGHRLIAEKLFKFYMESSNRRLLSNQIAN